MGSGHAKINTSEHNLLSGSDISLSTTLNFISARIMGGIFSPSKDH